MKKLILILCIVCIAGSFSACNKSEVTTGNVTSTPVATLLEPSATYIPTSTVPTKSLPSATPGITAGNTSGNLANGGMAVEMNGWVYFNGGDGLYKISADGKNKQKIYRNSCQYINIVGEWAYFIDTQVYKVRTNGTGLVKLNNEKSSNLCVSGDWVFYCNYELGGIVKIKTDGTNRAVINKKANKVSDNGLYVSGDWVYYFDESSRSINKMQTDGSHITKIIDIYPYCFNIVGDWIYIGRNDSLSKVRIDGSDYKILQKRQAFSINVYDDWIFYINDDCLYKIKIDGTHDTKILDRQMIGRINVTDKWIYSFWDTDGIGIFRVNKDGYNKKVIYENIT